MIIIVYGSQQPQATIKISYHLVPFIWCLKFSKQKYSKDAIVCYLSHFQDKTHFMPSPHAINQRSEPQPFVFEITQEFDSCMWRGHDSDSIRQKNWLWHPHFLFLWLQDPAPPHPHPLPRHIFDKINQAPLNVSLSSWNTILPVCWLIWWKCCEKMKTIPAI